MKLAVRTASGVGLLVILFAAIVLGVDYLAGFIGLVAGLSLYEYRELWRHRGLQPAVLVLVPLSAFWLFRYAYPQIPTASVGLLAAGLAGLALTLALGHEERPIGRWATATAGAIWLGYLPGCLLLLYVDAGSRGRAEALIALTVGIGVLGDTGAYLAGSWLGRHHFFPRVSPSKTWEGAVVGFLLPTVLAGMLLPVILPRLDHLVAFGIAAAAAAAAIVGDLVESQLKREVGVKDSGWLIPGHGGLLDRLDSLIFVGAVVYSLLGVAHAF